MRLASVFYLVVSVLLASGAESAVMRGNFKDPAYPGKCVVDGFVLKAGRNARHPRTCMQILCGQNGDVELHSCISEAFGPRNLKYGEYITPNADYPACCERYIIKA